MKMTFRWYGEDDPVTLDKIRQIPGMTGVVTAVYSVPVGEVWPVEDIQKLKADVQAKGLEMEVIESVPVHEDVKLRRGDYQRWIMSFRTVLTLWYTTRIRLRSWIPPSWRCPAGILLIPPKRWRA